MDIIGEGEAKYVSSLKGMVDELSLGSIVKFKGGLYDRDKLLALQKADALILPTFSENFGIIIGEALSCGTPVITTTGTPWEKIYSKKCGWYVEPTPEGLESALLDFLVKQPGDLQAMGLKGRVWIEKEYSVIKTSNRMIETYQKYLQNEN